ncbi:hypothetical protein F5Y03DRAFT_114574 [Xylaria venustula]|nr:hypothetical protein F5Y03DRAFT_114574 [Xylaria venustula]
MALEFFAGHIADNLNLGNLTLSTPDVADISISNAVLEERDDPQTVNIFFDNQDANVQLAASVVEACASQTVYAVRCTAGTATYCGGTGPTATITENASQYIASTTASVKTEGHEAKLTAIESCELDGTTKAICVGTAVLSVDGEQNSNTGTTTYTDAATRRFDVSITAGNDKLANPTGKCSAASNINTRAVALWGLLGAIGAIGVMTL